MSPPASSSRSAVTDAKRSTFFPNLPTMIEAGVPDCVSVLWFGISAPTGTPQPVIDKLSRAANEALKSDEVTKVAERADRRGAGRHAGRISASHMEAEQKRWNAVVEAAGLRK